MYCGLFYVQSLLPLTLFIFSICSVFLNYCELEIIRNCFILFTLPGRLSSQSTFSVVFCFKSLVFCVLLCQSLFSPSFFWPFYCLYFVVRSLITRFGIFKFFFILCLYLLTDCYHVIESVRLR
jgi:hypothetical protein